MMKRILVSLAFLLSAQSAMACHDSVCYYDANGKYAGNSGDNTTSNHADQVVANNPNYSSWIWYHGDEPHNVGSYGDPQYCASATNCPAVKPGCENTPGSVNDCQAGTQHHAGHTLNIHMGGFEDGLYVCKVEVLGHLCDLDDANVDADVITDAQGNLLGDGKSYTFDAPVMTSVGTSDHQTTELHLNSFRFGSMYRVTYCYNFNRVVSRNVTNQSGHLYGSMSARMAADNYASVAGVSATLDYSCSDSLGPVAAGTPVTYTGLDASSNNTLDVDAIFANLGVNLTGHCEFTVDFVEDGNVGTIRPVDHTTNDGVTLGTINSDVDLNMDLIQGF
jgi:hypothetical protein